MRKPISFQFVPGSESVKKISIYEEKKLETTSLFIYYNSSTISIMNIMSDLVTKEIREFTSQLYDRHDEEELSLYIFNSLGVGAGCMLFSNDFKRNKLRKLSVGEVINGRHTFKISPV